MIASQVIVQELHCTVLSTTDYLVHKSKVEIESLLKESFIYAIISLSWQWELQQAILLIMTEAGAPSSLTVP